MPKVGKKEFPYNAKGMKMAKEEAAKKGMPVKKAASKKVADKKAMPAKAKKGYLK